MLLAQTQTSGRELLLNPVERSSYRSTYRSLWMSEENVVDIDNVWSRCSDKELDMSSRISCNLHADEWILQEIIEDTFFWIYIIWSMYDEMSLWCLMYPYSITKYVWPDSQVKSSLRFHSVRFKETKIKLCHRYFRNIIDNCKSRWNYMTLTS